MNRKREVIVTVTYNELGIILDAKAEPRKTGRWEYIDYGGFGNYHCTACREICICNGDYDFCPNCGARMKEEGEG